MFLSPSKILYTHQYDPAIRMSTEQTFSELTKNSIHGSVFPKLQVVKKDGFYFTLNDAKLQVYRHLEKLGKCGSVEVEKVALKEVPEGIRQLMKAPEKVKRRRSEKSRTKDGGKYTSVSSSSTIDIPDADSLVLASRDDVSDGDETSGEESSDEDDTDSDSSDWSDEDVSDTDIQTDEDERSRLQPQDYSAANNDENESFI
ncbi:protein starmaker-like [Mya arenaria]|uniref:protein starmaker-like n=1 Tax=Mya arenaria TaxID=6604 RepID=UPI0022E8F4A1|nr:protein starmaker-like [Mya arenaria]